jgi:hypothetical protein
MQQRRFGRVMLSLVAVLVMAASLTIFGCSDDDENDNARLLENRTLRFDGALLDASLAGTDWVLEFGTANGDQVPFTLTSGIVEISGTATVNSIDFEIEAILVGDVPVSEITIGDKTFRVGDIFTLDAEFIVEGDTVTIILTNPDTGVSVTFEFPPGVNDVTGTTGSTGG